jgi:hypothetical protein
MTESKNLEGILVSNIPFSHPAHVPQILMLLRQQALFNVLVSSCIRPASKHGTFYRSFCFSRVGKVVTVIVAVVIIIIVIIIVIIIIVFVIIIIVIVVIVIIIIIIVYVIW